MKRIRIIGLCLVASFAISAMAVATASAAAPEYGRCVKVAGGKYYTSACDKEKAGDLKYEWEPGVGAANGWESTGGAGKLETKAGKTVTCETENATGTFVKGGNNKDESVPKGVNFTGCSSSSFTCTTTGDKTGELTTVALDGEVNWEDAAKHAVDLVLFPASGTHFINFKCVELEIEVAKKGAGILVKLKDDKMTKVEKLIYKATKGVQKPDVWHKGEASEEKAYLESNFSKTGFEQSGQTITSTVTGEEELELNAYE